MVKIVEKVFILLIIVATSFSTIILMNFESVKFNHYGTENQNEFSIKLSQDLLGPNITFVQPSKNNSIIDKRTYEIIVNVTDENPPTFGNVSIQISNTTTLLFSAPMNHSGNNLWNFIWDNVSHYESYIICIIRIWSMDSLSNENWSEPWYVLIYLIKKPGPNIIVIIFYIIISALIFALIILFFNRRLFFRVTREEQ
jgi:hypothetical protein